MVYFRRSKSWLWAPTTILNAILPMLEITTGGCLFVSICKRISVQYGQTKMHITIIFWISWIIVAYSPINREASTLRSLFLTIPPYIRTKLSEGPIKVCISTLNNDKRYPRLAHSPKRETTISAWTIDLLPKEKLWKSSKRLL